jgi:pSer/pThr/pTyr-binding forkhead associated (FHA) protein
MVCWPLGTTLPTIHIGRSPTNDLVVPDIRVSHQHVRLRVGDTVSVEDVGSSSGTTVNGVTLAAHQPRALGEHDVVSLGGFELHVVGAVTLMEMLLNAGKGAATTLQAPATKSAR